MKQPNKNTARIDARVPSYLKEWLATAAALQGRSQTDFLITAISEVAQKTIAEHNVIKLCLEDQKAFADSLLDENPDMSRFERLREAKRDYLLHVESRGQRQRGTAGLFLSPFWLLLFTCQSSASLDHPKSG